MSAKQPAQNFLIPLLLIGAVIAAGYALRHTVSTFLLSFVLAYLLDPLVVFLERHGLKRATAIVVLYLFLAVAALFVSIYLVPFLNIRWEALLADLPRYIQKGKQIVLGTPEHQPVYLSDEWSWLFDRIVESMDTLLNKIGSGMYSAASRVAFNLLNLLLAPILVFFMLYYKADISGGIAEWLPAMHRETILALGREVNSSVGGYIRGQMIISLIVAVLATITLVVLEIDYPLLNGIFAGLSSILPFIGVILATLPPLFFAYVKFQSGVALIKVLAAFAVIYFLEGYLIKPLVFKKSMNLNPLVTIMVVMAFGEIMGFWGILLAIPIAASLKIVSAHFRHGDFTHGD